MRSIGERLKEWRQAAGMKQDIAAMRMGMSRTTLSAIEAGKREVLAKEIPGFVSLYGKSPEELLEGINGKMLEHYGVSPEQLRADAGESAPKLFQPVIKPISEVLGMPMGSGAEDTLYVATVQGMNYGAGVLAYPGFLDDAAEKLGGDFFILPSSIHEVLLMRDDGRIKAQELQDIISSVNKSEVMPEERLSDHAYRYDTRAHAFELAERFEARQRENPEHIAEDGRESVLTKLEDKKSEAAVKQPARDTAVKASRMRGGEAI